MSCHDFQQKCYLFLSGELTPEEHSEFEKHLKKCSDCRNELEEIKETLNWVSELKYEDPSSEVTNAVLEKARRKKILISLPVRLKKWVKNWTLTNRKLCWGLSVSFAAIILAVLVLDPVSIFKNGKSISKEILEWQDGFFEQADWIDKEMERIESGEMLSSYLYFEKENNESEEWISPMSEDINMLRGEIENLTKTIFGI